MSELVKALLATPEAQALLAQKKPQHMEDLIGGKGLIAQMLQPMMQELLDAEMTEHLGYPKHDSSGYLSGNNRNGSYLRHFKSSEGNLSLDVPRDRRGQFQSKTITSYKQISSELEQKIISLYALGTSTKDISEFLKETYGVEVSEGFISQVTNAILEIAKEWQQ